LALFSKSDNFKMATKEFFDTLSRASQRF
jgi:hypothetical protein